jgi:hypothetical protein
MATEWTKELFDLAYEFNAEPMGHPNTRPGIRLHYNRYVMFPEMLKRARFFIAHFGLTAADRVLVVGTGFGWTCEALQSLGIETIGTDISSYIFSVKDTSEDAEIADAITAVGLNPASGEGLVHFNRLRSSKRTNGTVLNEDSASNKSRNTVKRALSSDPTLIITEDLVTSLTDEECAQIQSFIEGYSVSRICHFLTEFANPDAPFFFNSKSIDEWKALFPTSTIIADGHVYRVA